MAVQKIRHPPPYANVMNLPAATFFADPYFYEDRNARRNFMVARRRSEGNKELRDMAFGNETLQEMNEKTEMDLILAGARAQIDESRLREYRPKIDLEKFRSLVEFSSSKGFAVDNCIIDLGVI
jgi:hypothetical protein